MNLEVRLSARVDLKAIGLVLPGGEEAVFFGFGLAHCMSLNICDSVSAASTCFVQYSRLAAFIAARKALLVISTSPDVLLAVL